MEQNNLATKENQDIHFNPILFGGIFLALPILVIGLYLFSEVS